MPSSPTRLLSLLPQIQMLLLPPPNTVGSADAALRSRDSLTAAQIGRILQQKPEIVIELKSLVADQLRQQGINTQADAITDEMLFGQIASNADLRANITLWLRARGYITEADLHRPLDDADDRAEDP